MSRPHVERWLDVHAIDHAREHDATSVVLSFADKGQRDQFMRELCTGHELNAGVMMHDHHCPIHPDP